MIYTNILAICKKWGIPISKLEKDCGIGNGVVRRWDSGSADVWLVKAAADYLGVTVDDLLQMPEGSEKAADKDDRRRRKETG